MKGISFGVVLGSESEGDDVVRFCIFVFVEVGEDTGDHSIDFVDHITDASESVEGIEIELYCFPDLDNTLLQWLALNRYHLVRGFGFALRSAGMIPF